MKIFCIGRNYADHAKELKNEIPDRPVIFMKPETAIVRKNQPFFYPPFSSDVHYELELVLRIGKVGKFIEPRFARRYIDAITVGIDFTARDLQSELKRKGLPWERAKAFDGSAIVGDFVPFASLPMNTSIDFQLLKNGVEVQRGSSADMLFSFDEIIAEISTFSTLKKGDLIFTGTPSGVGPVQLGDELVGFLNGVQSFHHGVR